MVNVRHTPAEGDSRDRRRWFGELAEQMAADHLIGLGWTLLARNWRIGVGELDLIGLDRETIVFVEVKALHAGGRMGPGRPVFAVGPAKQDRLARLASAWLSGPGRSPALAQRWENTRFDVVGIEFRRQGTPPVLEHIEDAFRPGDSRTRRPPSSRRGWR
jgi:putative endonuclease